jgi:hypothetical protein
MNRCSWCYFWICSCSRVSARLRGELETYRKLCIKSNPIMGREGERYTARILTGHYATCVWQFSLNGSHRGRVQRSALYHRGTVLPFRHPLRARLFADRRSLEAERRLSRSLSEMSFSQETHMDSVLTEEIFQFQLPAANTIGTAAGQPQSFRHVRPSRPCCHIRLQRGQRFSGRPESEPPQKGGLVQL